MSNKISAILIFVLLLAMSTLFFVQETKTISVEEKRELAKWPVLNSQDYFSGKYTSAINTYVNDHFPFRPFMVDAAVSIRFGMGFRLKNQEKFVVVPKKSDSEQPKDTFPSADLSDTVSRQFLDDFEEAYAGKMLILNGKVYTFNTGSPAMSPHFSKMLNEYADTLKDATRVFSCVAPLSSAFIPAKKYEKYSQRNKETLDAIKANLSDKVLFCDVLGELNKHVNEHLFFGSDHHWTALGAYYAYISFCKSAGIQPVPLDKMERKVKRNFLGSLYDLTRDKSVKDNPDSLVYYVPNVETEALLFNAYDLKRPQKTKVFCEVNNYALFICGDAPLIKIKTNVKNGKKAAVVKNSMGNAFAVYLISHYEEIYVFDFRYSKHNLLAMIEQEGINDLIFSLGMYGAMSHGTINMMRKLGKNKQQDYDVILAEEKRKAQALQDSLNALGINPQDSLGKPRASQADSMGSAN